MRLQSWMTGLGAGVLCTAAVLVAPGLQAQGRAGDDLAKRPISAIRSGIGTFTPAAADPKLAAMLSRSGLPDNGFRFTPSDSRGGANRAVTVAVRARSARDVQIKNVRFGAAMAPSVSLAPVAYNLGVSVGWKRFAAATDVAKIDLVTPSGSRDRADLGMTYSGKRAPSKIEAIAGRPLATAPSVVADMPNYSLDVGGSLSVTRNLALTAGVRYKPEDQRLPRLTTDNRRDSQAVYVGTAFRF